ncbi:MAG: hypothetical protein D6746_10890 [Bacteroidetes bacterium]|nr:MAG: hypothetical protein D6746_10890 [Bacteroidota bacterium]
MEKKIELKVPKTGYTFTFLGEKAIRKVDGICSCAQKIRDKTAVIRFSYPVNLKNEPTPRLYNMRIHYADGTSDEIQVITRPYDQT